MAALTDNERTILRGISQGRKTRDIAADMHLSEDTVYWYRKRLLARFKVGSSAAMVVKAMEEGLI